MRKIIFYLVLISSITTSTPVSGQRILTGRIVDKETGKPIKEAQIFQLDTNVKTVSNEFGFFQLQVDSTSNIKIEATYYRPIQIQITSLNNFEVELDKIESITIPTEEIYYIIEEPATFPGGMHKFYSYINKNMKVPLAVRNGKVSGKVLIEFVIDSLGQIPHDEIIIREGLCKPCDEEAIRLIKGSPKWNPGMQKGKPVRQRMVMPILFM
ncbi:MAG TPA: energy transducer TonB [Cyclobacteriaceae bacterium]|nr:energy transducer TonB [Cyclobacteriaceae bacterium]